MTFHHPDNDRVPLFWIGALVVACLIATMQGILHLHGKN